MRSLVFQFDSEFLVILKHGSVNFRLFSFETDGCQYISLIYMDDTLIPKKKWLAVFGRKKKIKKNLKNRSFTSSEFQVNSVLWSVNQIKIRYKLYLIGHVLFEKVDNLLIFIKSLGKYILFWIFSCLSGLQYFRSLVFS